MYHRRSQYEANRGTRLGKILPNTVDFYFFYQTDNIRRFHTADFVQRTVCSPRLQFLPGYGPVYSLFPTSRHNLVDKIMRFDASKIQVPSIFPLKAKNTNKQKLANTLMNFNNSSDVMMTSLTVKEGSATIRRLGSAILNS